MNNMSNLNMLKRQHSEVLSIIDNIEAQIMNGDLSARVKNISYNINILAGKLKMHLVSEDKYLYPNLMNNSTEKIRSTARAFNTEMGSLFDVFTSFVQKYNTPNKILNNKENFHNESKKIFRMIKDRIGKEDRELYPLIDK